MKKQTRKYNHLSDAGHGWVSVPYRDLRQLDIVDKITQYSYMGLTRAYLEEDADWTTFWDAAEKAGWKVTTKSTQCEADESWIRKMARYNPNLAAQDLRIGKWIKSGEVIYYVADETKNSFSIYMPNTSIRWRLPKSNPFAYFDSYLPDNYGAEQRLFSQSSSTAALE